MLPLAPSPLLLLQATTTTVEWLLRRTQSTGRLPFKHQP
jgi:hypothetical protein